MIRTDTVVYCSYRGCSPLCYFFFFLYYSACYHCITESNWKGCGLQYTYIYIYYWLQHPNISMNLIQLIWLWIFCCLICFFCFMQSIVCIDFKCAFDAHYYTDILFILYIVRMSKLSMSINNIKSVCLERTKSNKIKKKKTCNEIHYVDIIKWKIIVIYNIYLYTQTHIYHQSRVEQKLFNIPLIIFPFCS